MFEGFFKSKEWRNRLLEAAATSFGQASIAAAQSANLINPRRQGMSPGVGLISGAGKGIYLQGGLNEKHSYLIAPTIVMFANIFISQLAAPYFEGNRERALAWCATAMGSLCTTLAYCINPTEQPAPPDSQMAPKPKMS